MAASPSAQRELLSQKESMSQRKPTSVSSSPVPFFGLMVLAIRPLIAKTRPIRGRMIAIAIGFDSWSECAVVTAPATAMPTIAG
jgi:hypothetical protein